MRNPVEAWSLARLATVTAALSVIAAGAALWIHRNDAPLAPCGLASGSLQWTTDTAKAQRMIDEYARRGGVSIVVRGIAIDSVLLVPSYSGLLAIGCFWAVRSRAAARSTLGIVLGWGAVFAGGFDIVENAGILAMVLDRTGPAPLTGLASKAKWSLIAVSAA